MTNLTKEGDDVSVVVVNLYDAKTQLSALVDRAAAGQEIVIAKNGKPMAKLVPYRERPQRKPGRFKGKIWMSDDFDAPMPDVADAFENSVIE